MTPLTPLSSLAPAGRSDQTLAHNMKLLAHHTLEGFGGLGEGVGMQLTDDGRRVLWLAHESAPKNFTGVDVTDPSAPKVLVQTELPHMKMRSNSLDVCGNIMAVAYQVQVPGMQPAGFDLFDISVPEAPKLLSHFDCSGPWSRGVHALWFVDGKTVHMASGAPDYQPHDQRDDQIYRIVDVSDLHNPVEAGRWWLPGTRVGDETPPVKRLPPQFDTGFRAHNTNVFPERPDRAYIGYIDGGAIVLDIADPKDIKVVAHWNHSPPYNGFTHTVLPLFSRNLWIVSDECVQDDGKDWPKLVWVVDARSEAHPLPIGTFPMPPVSAFGKRGGRFGAHNLHENLPVPCSFKSDTIIVGTFFNGGVRVFDTSDPYRVEEIAYYVPGAPLLSPAGSIQFNDVYVDDRQIVYAVDRFSGGLYILEMTL
jgi:hypothetical protein